MELYIKHFSKLTAEELYRILAARSEIFVVEQDCVYQDLDGKDLRMALPLIAACLTRAYPMNTKVPSAELSR